MPGLFGWKRLGRFALAVGLILPQIILAACTALPADPVLTVTPTPVSNLFLRPCRLSAPGLPFQVDAECAILEVYEDSATRTGRTIQLAIARIPAVSRTPQPDPLFLLAGGPGQAATEAFLPFLSAFERIRRERDLVLVDQRGTGSSHALRCPQNGADVSPLDGGIDEARQAELIRACLAQLDGDPRFYTTAATVQDLDEVRRALGYQQINLLGVSYGTRVALAYLQEYPDRVRSLVLDSVTPLDWQLGPTSPRTAQRALDLIFARCTADPGCQAAFPNLSAEFNSVLSDLDRQPVEVSMPDPQTGEPTQVKMTHQIAAATIQALSYAQETASLLPLLIHTSFASKNYQMLAAQYLVINQQQSKSVADGLYLSVVCTEDVPFYPAPTGPASVDSYLPANLDALKKACALWPHEQLAAPPVPVEADTPALLLSGEADPITPPENAAQAARSLPGSLQVTAPGMGHNVIFRGCLPTMVAEFVAAGSSRRLKTGCVQDIQPAPFFLNFAGPKP